MIRGRITIDRLTNSLASLDDKFDGEWESVCPAVEGLIASMEQPESTATVLALCYPLYYKVLHNYVLRYLQIG